MVTEQVWNMIWWVISCRDSDGYVVDSGEVIIDKTLGKGDKFQDDSLMIFDLVPGEEYVLTFQMTVRVNKENLPDHRLSNICDWAGFYSLIFY